jgi:hypothetical protein
MRPVRVKRATLQVVLLACMLFVQQGAVFHALSHIRFGDDSSETAKSPGTPASPACGQCIAFHSVGSAVPLAAPVPTDLAPASASVPHFTEKYLPLPSAPFLAQAPPRSLS